MGEKQAEHFLYYKYVMISLHSAFLCVLVKNIKSFNVFYILERSILHHDVTSAELRTGASKYTKLLVLLCQMNSLCQLTIWVEGCLW